MRAMNMLGKAEEKVWLLQHNSFGLHADCVACNFSPPLFSLSLSTSPSPLLLPLSSSLYLPPIFPLSPLLPSFLPLSSPFLPSSSLPSPLFLPLSSLPSQYNDLLKKKQIVENDKSKIGELITELDQKKNEALQGAYERVNKVSKFT